jgi:RNA polymerase sigma-70 factor, ECF subfamily
MATAKRKHPRAHEISDSGACDDAEVLAAVRGGRKAHALTLLMDSYGDSVLRFAYVMTHDRELAEDVRQQVFVEAHRDLERFEGRSSLRTWLFGIAHHRSLDAARKQRRWICRFKNDAPPEPEPEVVDLTLDQELDRDRLARILAACLAKLAPAAREAVVMRYQQELTYDETSAIVGDRTATLQQRVARALPVLRRCLEARLGRRKSR